MFINNKKKNMSSNNKRKFWGNIRSNSDNIISSNNTNTEILDNINTSSQSNIKNFDLNIEKILENWEVSYAIREIIANALDEQKLTNTQDIQIYKKGNNLFIRDFGRGLNYHHFTQNENQEKLKHDGLIGRFGVGLKDALATLYRHNIKVTITSKYGQITLKEIHKNDFDDVVTLHAQIEECVPPSSFLGTEFKIENCPDDEIIKAKKYFLFFSDCIVLEDTKYGQIIKKIGNNPCIYINGVKVAEEPNFLFSYNITSLNQKLKNALNRERTNVGRSAYTDRVKSILLESQNKEVLETLSNDIKNYATGLRHDELNWKDVELHASKKLAESNDKVVFITTKEIEKDASQLPDMKKNGFTPVIISEKAQEEIETYNYKAEETKTTPPIPTVRIHNINMEKTRNHEYIDINDLSEEEKEVFYSKDKIHFLSEKVSSIIKNYDIKIVPIIYSERPGVAGLWVPSEKRILIRKDQLTNKEIFLGTLFHEYIHAITGYSDCTRDFENVLTQFIGNLLGLLIDTGIQIKEINKVLLEIKNELPNFEYSTHISNSKEIEIDSENFDDFLEQTIEEKHKKQEKELKDIIDELHKLLDN